MNTITKRLSLSTLALLVLAAFLPSPAPAAIPGVHPAYLHALEDLRFARAYLARQGGDSLVKWDETMAIKEIAAAIKLVTKAALDDGKNPAVVPPADAKLPYGGRLSRALKRLREAHDDLKGREDNYLARGPRLKALEHIKNAIRMTEQGIADAARQ